MLAELKSKSQVTIPKKVVTELGLEYGDQFEVVITDAGSIELIPVVVYPKQKIVELEQLAAQARTERENGTAQIFDNADDLIAELHKG